MSREINSKKHEAYNRGLASVNDPSIQNDYEYGSEEYDAFIQGQEDGARLFYDNFK